ncbi:fluoride efflux transporter CrcB [Halomicronema sp. CCY15110]|uniref:fluoride efflux transporter CrcB n=1 Tax=Halomicronema sp. CCY15110 TaxID=2767773 RepID=UPI0019517F8A|nr:fluoride efflux transporter CrcB [Halomicronema sp. CCY15110]
MDWTPIAISIGAVGGALSRYYLSLYWLQRLGDRFPYGTLCVNLTGAFAMGWVATVAPRWGLSELGQTLLMTGFLGAYTTFSTYLLDTVKLLSSQQRLQALGYWLGSTSLGLVCVELGIWLGGLWR